MESADLNAMDEEAIFAAEFREQEERSRKPVVLRTKIRSTGKEKQANSSRFKHRTAAGFQAKNVTRREK